MKVVFEEAMNCFVCCLYIAFSKYGLVNFYSFYSLLLKGTLHGKAAMETSRPNIPNKYVLPQPDYIKAQKIIYLSR